MKVVKIGYITEYQGIIHTNSIKVRTILKYLHLLNKDVEFSSSFANGETTYTFHKEDEWIMNLADVKDKDENYEYEIFLDEEEIRINHSGKIYDNAYENLLLLIGMLDKEANGILYFRGEEFVDMGYLRLKEGEVFKKVVDDNETINYTIENYNNEVKEKETYRKYDIKIKYLNEKKDILNKIKNNTLDWNEINREVMLNKLEED